MVTTFFRLVFLRRVYFPLQYLLFFFFFFLLDLDERLQLFLTLEHFEIKLYFSSLLFAFLLFLYIIPFSPIMEKFLQKKKKKKNWNDDSFEKIRQNFVSTIVQFTDFSRIKLIHRDKKFKISYDSFRPLHFSLIKLSLYQQSTLITSTPPRLHLHSISGSTFDGLR